MDNQIITVKIMFKANLSPGNPAHLEHVAKEWARSKGAEIIKLESGEEFILI